MNVKPVDDRALLESVLLHPAIFAHIAEDGAPRQIPDARYLGGFVGSACVGLLAVDCVSRHVADVHIHVLPEHRARYAEQFAHACIDWLFGNGFSKLVAQIPFCCENVKRFSERVGFEVEGINRKSWHKHGKMWDSWYLGCVRAEEWAR